jgi:hypothetical protein
VLAPGRCKVGLVLGFLQGGVAALGVDGGGVVEDQREGVLAGRVCLGLPLSLDSKLKTTRGRGF